MRRGRPLSWPATLATVFAIILVALMLLACGWWWVQLYWTDGLSAP